MKVFRPNAVALFRDPAGNTLGIWQSTAA